MNEQEKNEMVWREHCDCWENDYDRKRVSEILAGRMSEMDIEIKQLKARLAEVETINREVFKDKTQLVKSLEELLATWVYWDDWSKSDSVRRAVANARITLATIERYPKGT